MQGVVFVGDRRLELQRFDDPTPGPGEVVLEIKASGMCGTDLKYYRAPVGVGAAAIGLKADQAPVIAGHEPCGVVAAVGAGVSTRQARVGMRAMQHHYKGCGCCAHCWTGWTQMCDHGAAIYGATAHGAHARYMVCPAQSLIPLPEELSFTTGAAIACGTGTAWGALQRLGLQANHTIAIFGQGPVGLSATQLAASMGARVIAVDIGDERLATARQLGAELTINARTLGVDPEHAIREATAGLGADLSLEAAGAADARRNAVRCLKTWGKSCFVGEGGEVSFDVSGDLLRRQISVLGSWTMSIGGQADCARYVAERGVAVDDLFTHRWRLEQAQEAYQHFDRQTDGKGVFLM
jgi:D-arabinose 1-dehydrogenase-like Zn-dependent alcohol dehydrogenase